MIFSKYKHAYKQSRPRVFRGKQSFIVFRGKGMQQKILKKKIEKYDLIPFFVIWYKLHGFKMRIEMLFYVLRTDVKWDVILSCKLVVKRVWVKRTQAVTARFSSLVCVLSLPSELFKCFFWTRGSIFRLLWPRKMQ